ncbi:MAG: hypothetical protein F2922_07060, partial [Actinobacteria bacterium]|nr:hypothetical protein [Actinomycetota bacterium]
MRRQIKRTDPSGIEVLASNHEDESSEVAITSDSNLLARLFLQRSRNEVAPSSRPRFFDRFFRRRKDAQASIPDTTPTSSVLELPSGLTVRSQRGKSGRTTTTIGLRNGSKIELAYQEEKEELAIAGGVSASSLSASSSIGGAVLVGGVSAGAADASQSGFSYVLVDSAGAAHHAQIINKGELSTEHLELVNDISRKHIRLEVNERLQDSNLGISIKNSDRNSVILKSEDGSLITIRDDGTLRILTGSNNNTVIDVVNGQRMSMAAGSITANISAEEIAVLRQNNPLITIEPDKIINNFVDGSKITHFASGDNVLTPRQLDRSDERSNSNVPTRERDSQPELEQEIPAVTRVERDETSGLRFHSSDGSTVEIPVTVIEPTPKITLEPAVPNSPVVTLEEEVVTGTTILTIDTGLPDTGTAPSLPDTGTASVATDTGTGVVDTGTGTGVVDTGTGTGVVDTGTGTGVVDTGTG